MNIILTCRDRKKTFVFFTMSRTKKQVVVEQKNELNVDVESSEIKEILITSKSAKIQKYIGFIKAYGFHSDPEKFLPEFPSQEAKIYFSGSYTAFANMLRRVLIDELPVKYLSIDDEDIKKDEPYILPNDLCLRVSTIPIHQSIDLFQFKEYKISLQVTNTSNTIMQFFASDIKITDGKREIPINTLIPNSNIVLDNLFPGKSIRIANFKIKTGIKLTHGAGCASLLSSVTMVPGKLSPADKKNMLPTARSVDTQNTDFYIAFRTCGNIETHAVANLLEETVNARLDIIATEIALAMENKSNMIVMERTGKRMRFVIQGEYLSLPTVIAAKVFQLDPTIEFIGVSSANNTEINSYITIEHPNPAEIIRDAIKIVRQEVSHFVHQVKKITVIREEAA